MKKLLSLLVATGVLTAANVMAADIDLVSAAQKAQNAIDTNTKKVEDAKSEATKKWEAKKAEQEKLKAEKKAALDAKKAEQKKALEETKGSLNNLENALTK